MTTGGMRRMQLEANIAESRRHITKQEALIKRLTDQGHVALLAEATALLAAMRGHLETELNMLGQMGPV